MHKKILILILSVIPFLFLLSESHNKNFSIVIGREKHDSGHAVIRLQNGDFLVFGNTESFGYGKGDMIVVTINSIGEKIGQRTFGNRDSQSVNAAALTQDNGYITAGTSYNSENDSDDMWIMRFDQNGDVLWEWAYGGKQAEQAFSVISLEEGGILAGGFTESYGAGGQDMFLIKTDTSGRIEWSKTYGGEKNDTACSLVQTESGGFMVLGTTESFGAGLSDFWLLEIDKNGGIIRQKSYGDGKVNTASALLKSGDGGFVLCGNTGSTNSEDKSRALIIRIDVSGNILWKKQTDYSDADIIRSAVSLPGPYYVFSGSTIPDGKSQSDSWLFRMDESGNILWQKTYGGEKQDSLNSVISVEDDGFIATGSTESFGSGKKDIWVLRFDNEGNAEIE